MWPLAGPAIAELMHNCVPDDPALEGQVFTLLVTISADGVPSNTEVKPQTKVTTCVARGIVRIPFPKPPHSISAGGLPLVFVLHIKMHKP